LWLGVLSTLLGGLGACGDDDGDGTPNATGGASTGGTKSGSGGVAGTGGSKVSGGSSGATSKGGSGGSSGGSSGASTGGAGGIASIAGEGGIPGEGGTGPVAGSPGGGSGGDAGSSTVAGSPNGGDSGAGATGSGGRAGGGASGSGGSGGGAAGSGGGAEVSVEYRSCEKGAAVTRVELYRIDRAQQTCALVVVQQGQVNCLEGLKSGGWCVISAAIGSDVEACEAFEPPNAPVQATAGEGTFTISTQPLAIDMDVTFEFPPSSGLPESVSVEADNCLADCVMNDCRP
jgi:hypothetical protein